MNRTVEVTINDIPVNVTLSHSEYGADADGNRGMMRWELESVEPLYDDFEWDDSLNEAAFEKALDYVCDR